MKDLVIKLIIYCTFVLKLRNVESTTLFPNKQMSIVKNEGFLIHIVHQHNFKLQKCSLTLEGKEMIGDFLQFMIRN